MNDKDIMNDQDQKHTEMMPEEQAEQTAQEEQAGDAELEACQAELSVWKDRCVRAMADFQNYQQRSEKERVMWMDRAQERVLHDMLATYDDIDRALAQLQGEQQGSVWLQGLELIQKQMLKTFEKYQVKEFAQYQEFDPELHEAIGYVSADGKASGSIAQVHQKGFMYKDKVLRIAKVSVAQ